jgi:CheY-like chemotaxis protein
MSHTLIPNGTVLLVNDDVNARIIEEALLEGRGLPVRAVADGYDACDQLARDGLGIAVLVIRLEINAKGMNGWQLLRHLRSRFQPILPPVQPRTVVTTARQDLETAGFVKRLGADAVLQRPIAPRDFIDTVERLMPWALAPLVAQLRHAEACGHRAGSRREGVYGL